MEFLPTEIKNNIKDYLIFKPKTKKELEKVCKNVICSEMQ